MNEIGRIGLLALHDACGFFLSWNKLVVVSRWIAKLGLDYQFNAIFQLMEQLKNLI